ncbi:MAG: iron-containing alcohol dehydrogenase, partial [Bdellovibrionales bacterium]|nr:iron-containing alcohol dehydrogenase [Bdellovibrionales bacterium]
MKQFNYPTTILYGEGSLKECANRMTASGCKRPLFVTDGTLVKLGLAGDVKKVFEAAGVKPVVFDEVHPNPIEEDVEKGAAVYKREKCDSVIALGGGSPMDAAKGIMLAATHSEPLAVYDDAIGGDRKIVNPLPPLYAIPTTAGTGSEVGRAGVIILRETNNKTILFHPTMLPRIAVLEPSLTAGLPPGVTAATGIDAFTHCLEAYFASGFHPMADGVALEGIRIILRQLPVAVKDGKNLDARAQMLLAASMGATAFQKGLGMIHSLAHPLSSECGLHHGLANAVMLPKSVEFLERSALNADQRERVARVQSLFQELGLAKGTLSGSCKAFIESV